MTDTRCEAFMQDPERFASHPDDCADCRKLMVELEQLDRDIVADRLETRPEDGPAIVKSLPLAAWEGARFRSWPLAIASAIVILAAAASVFAMVGISPLAGVVNSIYGQLTHSVGYVDATRHVAGMLQRAPIVFHVGVAVAFLAVNAVFYYLLRRAPRGIDVSSR